MKTAKTIADAANITKGDVFGLEEAYMRSVALVPRDDRGGVFHPSAVGMCARRNVYEYTNTPSIKTIDPDDMEVFDMGHAVHEIVQTKLKNLHPALDPEGLKYEFQEEVRYDPATDKLIADFGIGGTCDGVLRIWHEIEGSVGWEQRSIVEIKSIKDKNYHLLTGPKEDHLMQAHIYAYRFDCPIMYLWYYNKDTSKRRVYPVVFDKEILMGALERFALQLKHADAGTLPEREESWWMCPRCGYRDVCKPPILASIKHKERKKQMRSIRKKGTFNRIVTTEET